MAVSTNDLKNGMALNLPSEGLVTVVEFQHVKPGKGGAFVRTKLKNVRSGAVLDRTYRADEKLPLAVIDEIATLEVVPFVSVNDFVALVVPATTLPKSMLVVDTVMVPLVVEVEPVPTT